MTIFYALQKKFLVKKFFLGFGTEGGISAAISPDQALEHVYQRSMNNCLKLSKASQLV